MTDQTQEFVLRAMAQNYGDGPHCWDKLDKEVCFKAADEIKTLRESNKTFADCAIGRMDQLDDLPNLIRERDELKIFLEEEQANAARAWSAHENVLKQLVSARTAAFEECAKICDRLGDVPGCSVADEIRTLLTDDKV